MVKFFFIFFVDEVLICFLFWRFVGKMCCVCKDMCNGEGLIFKEWKGRCVYV